MGDFRVLFDFRTEENILCHYTFNDSLVTPVLDSSGNDYHLTGYNTPSIVTGVVGSARQFNGSTQYYAGTIGTITEFPLSASAYIKRTAYPSGDPETIVSLYSNGAALCSLLMNSSGELIVQWQDAGNTERTLTSTGISVPLNTFVEVGFDHAGDTDDGLSIIMAGAEIASTTTNTTLYNDPGTCTIEIARGVGEYFSGIIDDVWVFTRLLTEDEWEWMADAPEIGPNWIDVSDTIRWDDFSIERRPMSENFRHAEHEASFTMLYDTVYYPYIIDPEVEILIRIQEDIVGTWTDKFVGRLPRERARTYDGQLTLTQIKLRATDFSKWLEVQLGDVVYEDIPLWDSTDPENSLIHAVFDDIGLSRSLIDDTINIAITQEAANTSSDTELASLFLEQLFYENGYVLTWSEAGKLTALPWIVAEESSVATFDDSNIIEQITMDDSFVEALNGYEIVWYELDEEEDVLVYRERLPYDEYGAFEGYPILAGTYFPPQTNTIDPYTETNKQVFQEYTDEAIRYMTNYAIVNNTGYNYKAFESDFSSMIRTSNHTLDWNADADIELNPASPTYGNRRAEVRLLNTGAGSARVYYLNILADVLYRSAARRVTVSMDDSLQLQPYETRFIFDETKAIRLGQALENSAENGAGIYRFSSEVEVLAGAVVTVDLNEGTLARGIVIARNYDHENEIFDYTFRKLDGEYRTPKTDVVITSSQFEVTQSQASANRLAAMSADNIITTQEKLAVLKEWEEIEEEYSLVLAEADNINVPPTDAEYVAYVAAYADLDTYLSTSVLNDMTVNSIVVGATFRLKFATYYQTKQDLKAHIQVFITTDEKLDSGTLPVTPSVLSAPIAGADIEGDWLVTGSITSGTGNDVSVMSGADEDYRFWAGHAEPASAPFSITKEGVLNATGAVISGTITAETGAIGGWTIGETTLSGTSAVLSSTGVLTLGTGNSVVVLSAIDTVRMWAGHATYALANFRLGTNGAIYATKGTVGGWYLGSAEIYSGTVGNESIYLHQSGYMRVGLGNNATYLSGIDATYRIWAGHATAADAPFSVTKAGVLSATGATITGTITAEAGAIGGWTIGETTLTGGDTVLSSAGTLTLGTGDNVAIISSADEDYRLWIGDATPAAADFSVTKAGAMYAVSGSIGSWEIYEGILTSRTAGTGAGITLNHGASQIGVYDSTNQVTANGFLNGLPKRDGTGNWGAGDYGYWVRPGDRLVIDGDAEVTANGDWLIESNASYRITTTAVGFGALKGSATATITLPSGSCPAGDISIYMRLYIDDTTTPATTERLWTQTGGNARYLFRSGTTGNLVFVARRANGTTGVSVAIPQASIPEGETFDIVAKQISGVVTIWLNGVLIGTETPADIYESFTDNAALLSSTTVTLNYQDIIDEVRIYSDDLSEEEIAGLHTNPSGGPWDNMTLRYAFDESAGTTVIDSSGNGRHSTYTGCTRVAGLTDLTSVRLGTIQGRKGLFINEGNINIDGTTVSVSGSCVELSPERFFVGSDTSYILYDADTASLSLNLVTLYVSSLQTNVAGTLYVSTEDGIPVDYDPASDTNPIAFSTDTATLPQWGRVNHKVALQLAVDDTVVGTVKPNKLELTSTTNSQIVLVDSGTGADYQKSAWDHGDGIVSLKVSSSADVLTSTPITINQQAPDNTIYVQADGDIGFGIGAPVSKGHFYENTTNTGVAAGLTIEQDGTGDAVAQFLLTGGQRWVMGIDNSDSDKFKIASSADLKTDARVTVDTSGNVLIGATLQIGATGAGSSTDTSQLRISNTGAGTQSAIYFADPTNIAYGGRLYYDDTASEFRLVTVNNNVETVSLSLARASGNVTFNDAGADIDFRVEAVGQENAFFVQGSNGYIGCGTRSPARQFTIANAGESIIGFTDASNDENAYIGGSADSTGGKLRFFTANSSGTLTEKMRITKEGNVGIGTTAPASLVEIQGGLTTTGAVLTLGTKETTVVANDILGRINFYAPLEASGTDAILPGAAIYALAEGEFSATSNATSLVFGTGASETAAEKMRLTSGGALLLGTTVAFGTERLLVSGTSIFTGGITAQGGIALDASEAIYSDELLLTYENFATLRATTNDGSDSAVVTIAGGGAVADTRGGYIQAFGNEHATYPGRINIYAGNDSDDGEISLATGGVERINIGYTGIVTFDSEVLVNGRYVAPRPYGSNAVTAKAYDAVDFTVPYMEIGEVRAYEIQINSGAAGSTVMTLPVVGGEYLVYSVLQWATMPTSNIWSTANICARYLYDAEITFSVDGMHSVFILRTS